MTSAELDSLMEFLKELAPTNPERIQKLKDLLLKASKDEVQQLDSATLTWLLGVVMDAERKDLKIEVVTPMQKGPVKFADVPSDMAVRDPDDWDEVDYQWGV